jgi:Domain of unknown function (DUF4282)
MTDTPEGPGWWQASDGKYYPPEQRPSQDPPPSYRGPTDPGTGPGGQVDAKGFVTSLYDFKFDHFVTPKLIRFFYAFFVIVLTLGAVVFLLASLASGEGATVFFALVVVPIGYFAYLILTRMYFELVAALFRITDDLRAIRKGNGF